MFATQDARQTDAFWRLAEVMGRLNARLYCCSGDMIAGLQSGDLALAYNVVGSYALTQLSNSPDIAVIEPEDFTVAVLRTAFVPVTATRALANATLPHITWIADEGVAGALRAHPELRPGVNVRDGKVVNAAVAEALAGAPGH